MRRSASSIRASRGIATSRIGIVGAGRLGSVLAAILVARGLPRDCLFLSTGGGGASLERLRKSELLDRVTTNEILAESCEIILVALRPQSLASFRLPHRRDGSLVLSCMAGVPLRRAETMSGGEAVRAMTSGPDTIAEGRGVAVLYPVEARATRLFAFLGIDAIALREESLIDAFTAAVCLPAALALEGDSARADLAELAAEYPELSAVFQWAPGVLPPFPSAAARLSYLERMITPGGLTERIVEATRRGEGIRAAFREGLVRAREISASLA